MTSPILRLWPCVILPLVAGLLSGPPAMAQPLGSDLPTGPMFGNGHAATTPPPKEAAPAALPGAQTRPNAAAPLTKAPSEMGPNEALFDAVNRDDIAAARDAISRGADLKQHNVLGLTALDLAVDLGYNDIAFLLLSMRGVASPGVAGRPPAASSVLSGGGPEHPPVRPSVRPAAVAAGRPAPSVTREPPSRQVASDGGAPIPNAGFLGFGNAR